MTPTIGQHRGHPRYLALAILGLAFALPWAAGAGPVQLAQRDDNPLVCQEPTQEFERRGDTPNPREINFVLFDAAERGCGALVAWVLDAGASLAARDRNGNTALLIAARMGHREVVADLLDRGADLERSNLSGSTPLIEAAKGNHRSTVKLLLEAGAEANAADRQGVSALAAAGFNGNDRLVNLLLEHGADPGRIDRTGKGPAVYAAAKGFGGTLGKLLDAGVAVDARYGNDLTALMWAAGHGNDVPEAEGLATVRVLLERGASLDLADNRGRTALMIAAERGHAAIAALLVEAGADPARRDKDGKTAFDLTSAEDVRKTLGGAD